MRPARDRLQSVVEDLIAHRLGSGEERDDLLGLLLSAADEGSDQLRDDVLTILLAGHDTIANALTWTLSLLARHPRAEEGLHRELEGVIGDRSPASGDLDRLPFTRGVFAEALRLYPPAWVIARRALVDHEIEGTVI